MPRRAMFSAETVRTLGALSAVGISFVLAVVFGFLIGYVLDRWTGSSPLFTIVFFFFGLAAGMLNVVRTASRYIEERGPGGGPRDDD